MTPADRHFLLIGYGNTLRRDDGVGPRLADLAQQWRLPNLRVLNVQSLVPELAYDVSQADEVLFVDANPHGEELEVTCCEPVRIHRPGSHASDPAELLGLAKAVYGRCPPAKVLLVPAHDFAVGENMSPVAVDGMTAALAWIRVWVTG